MAPGVLKKYKAAQNWDAYLRSLRPYGIALVYTGQLETAYQLLGQMDSVERFHTAGIDAALEMLEYKAFLAQVTKKPEITIDVSNKSLELRRKNGIGIINEGAMRLYNALGGAYQDLGYLQRSLRYYDSALWVMEQALGKDDPFAINVNYHIATVYGQMASYDLALEHLDAARNVIKKRPDDDNPNNSFVVLAMAQQYTLRNKTPDDNTYALVYAQEAEAVMKKANAIRGYQHYFSEVYHLIHKNKGNYDSAKWYLFKAIEEAKAVYGDNFAELGTFYRKMADIQLLTGDLTSAQASTRKAINIYSQLLRPEYREIASAQVVLAEALAKAEKWEEAEQLYNTAIEVLAPGLLQKGKLNRVQPEGLTTDNYLLKALMDKALYKKRRALATNNLVLAQESLELYLFTTRYLNMARRGQLNELSKLQFNEQSSPLYEEAIELCIELYRKEGRQQYLESALQIAESRKATLLADQLAGLRARVFVGVPAQVFAQERVLRERIYRTEQQLYEFRKAGAHKESDSTATLLGATKAELDRFIRQTGTQYPRYIEFVQQQDAFRIDSYRSKLLEAKERALICFEGKEAHYLFLLTDNNISFHIADKRANTASAINRLRNSLFTKDPNTFATHAEALYTHLLKPLLDSSPGAVRIIPDGVLAYLPFEVLLTSKASSSSFHSFPYLIRERRVAYSSSLSLMLSPLADVPGRGRNSLRFAGYAPRFKDTGQTLLATRSAPDSVLLANLPQLPFAEQEVVRISGMMRGSSRLGGDATERNFRNDGQRAQILHFASHAMLNDENPMFSRLIFARDTSTSGDNDGLLHTYELFNLALNAELVTLSACNTGMGQNLGGEGVLSLARGFQYAGVPNVLMSLWEVPDQSSSELMTYFYEYLSQGQNMAEALHLAKLKYIEQANPQTANPLYWAGFVLNGEGGNLILSEQSHWPVWVWVMSVAVLLALGWIILRVVQRVRA
jgi:CHAT domain-containing protein